MINRSDFRLNELNKLIYSMEIIKNANKRSFNNLAEKIVKYLEKETDKNKLKRIIESELCISHGLFSNEFDSEQISNVIFKWWENSNH